MEEMKLDADGHREGHYKFDPDTAGAWVSCGSLSVGDYGGAGSVGEANIRVLQDKHRDTDECYVEYGGHGYKQAWLRDTEENRELIRRLEADYPLLDDDAHSQVEMDWEEEAWTGWLRWELMHTLGKSSPALAAWAEELDSGTADGPLWDCYRKAMEETNTYPTCEYNGVHVRTQDIQEEFESLVHDLVVTTIHIAIKQSGCEDRFAWGNDRTDRLVLADLICEKWDDPRAESLANYLRDSCEEVGLERAEDPSVPRDA